MYFNNTIKWLLAAVVIMVLSVTSAMAQDIIVKQDGETIKAYRTDIGKTTVYYQLEDNDGSLIFSLSKSEVLIIKMQDGTKIVMDEVGSKVNAENDVVREEYVPCFPAEPVADPEIIAKAKIGSLIEFYDGSKGVVFFLDGNGHGLAVYLNEICFCWQKASSWRDCIDIDAIPNESTIVIQMGLGALYCEAAVKQLGIGSFPAINGCRSIGPDWYLPSLGELYELMVVANLSKTKIGPISRVLEEYGGDPLTFSHYLSCSEADNTDLYSIQSGEVKNSKKYVKWYWRAIRMF